MADRNFKPLAELRAIDIQRFWGKVDIRSEHECWFYKGTVLTFQGGRRGYGQFVYNGFVGVASRIAYAIEYRADPGELMVCHSCDQKTCCNPKHLFLGSHLDNMRDGVEKGIFPSGERHHSTRGTMDCHRGEGNPAAKLNAEHAEQIRSMYAAGTITQRKLAKLFSVHQATIHRITSGKKWTILP